MELLQVDAPPLFIIFLLIVLAVLRYLESAQNGKNQDRQARAKERTANNELTRRSLFLLEQGQRNDANIQAILTQMQAANTYIEQRIDRVPDQVIGVLLPVVNDLRGGLKNDTDGRNAIKQAVASVMQSLATAEQDALDAIPSQGDATPLTTQQMIAINAAKKKVLHEQANNPSNRFSRANGIGGGSDSGGDHPSAS